jgi:hypothetical protein
MTAPTRPFQYMQKIHMLTKEFGSHLSVFIWMARNTRSKSGLPCRWRCRNIVLARASPTIRPVQEIKEQGGKGDGQADMRISSDGGRDVVALLAAWFDPTDGGMSKPAGAAGETALGVGPPVSAGLRRKHGCGGFWAFIAAPVWL